MASKTMTEADAAEQAAPVLITRAEAQQMAADAAEAAVERVLAAMAAKQAETPEAPAPQAGADMLAFVQQLAKSIAEVGNQGTGKVVVDPGVVQARENAKIRMFTLIAEAWRDQTAPEYVLAGKVHLNDQIIEPLWTDAMKKTHATKIVWYGPPNKAMRPAPGNKIADEIHGAMCEWIGQAPGIMHTLRPVDMKGRLVTPGGNVFADLEPIPRDFGRQTLVVEEGALPRREIPHNGLEIAGANGAQGRTVEVPILGTLVAPARQMVA